MQYYLTALLICSGISAFCLLVLIVLMLKDYQLLTVSYTNRLKFTFFILTFFMYVAQILDIFGKYCQVMLPVFNIFITCNLFYSVLIGYSLNYSIGCKIGVNVERFNPQRYEKLFLIASILDGLIFGLIPVFSGNSGTIYGNNVCWVTDNYNRGFANLMKWLIFIFPLLFCLGLNIFFAVQIVQKLKKHENLLENQQHLIKYFISFPCIIVVGYFFRAVNQFSGLFLTKNELVLSYCDNILFGLMGVMISIAYGYGNAFKEATLQRQFSLQYNKALRNEIDNVLEEKKEFDPLLNNQSSNQQLIDEERKE